MVASSEAEVSLSFCSPVLSYNFEVGFSSPGLDLALAIGAFFVGLVDPRWCFSTLSSPLSYPSEE